MTARIGRRGARVILVAALALTVTPVAGAEIREGRSPDTKDAAATARTMRIDGRSAARAAALLAHAGASATPADLGSPDTKDGAATAHASPTTVVVETAARSFDWGDAGIGAAAGVGLALILGGAALVNRLGSRRNVAL